MDERAPVPIEPPVDESDRQALGDAAPAPAPADEDVERSSLVFGEEALFSDDEEAMLETIAQQGEQIKQLKTKIAKYSWVKLLRFKVGY